MSDRIITSTNHLGQLCTLVLEGTTHAVREGCLRGLHNGGLCMVVGGRAPHKSSSTGRITVRAVDDARHCQEFYPSVAGLEWAVLPDLTGTVQPAVPAF